MEAIIYSANIGGYDTFKEPVKVDRNARYILFTDQDYTSEVWEVIKVTDSRHRRTVARDIKINAHKWLPKHDVSIWVDHSFAPVITDASIFDIPNNAFMCYAHEKRNCIYLEVMELLRLGHITNIEADSIIDELVRNNYYVNNGLSSSGFMVRGNSEKFNRYWWKLLTKFCERDQATQHYAAKLTNTMVLRPPQGASVYDNPYITRKQQHLKSSIIQR